MDTPTKPRPTLSANDVKRQAADALARVDGLVTPEEKRLFWERRPNPLTALLAVLVAAGAFVTALPVVGAVWGFWRAYRRILEPRHIPPNVYPLNPASRYGLTVGAFTFLWLLLGLGVALMIGAFTVSSLFGVFPRFSAWLVLNAGLSLAVALIFRWQMQREAARVEEGSRFGSARFSTLHELRPFRTLSHEQGGFYMAQAGGDFYTYQKEGHFLTVAGTRGGKGVNLILPNLLAGTLPASWVVVDPKGENAAVAAHAMRERGMSVHILNPWALLAPSFAGFPSATFNPLDLLTKGDKANIIDDADIIAEMIVPKNGGGADNANSYFNDRARSIISALILYIATDAKFLNTRTLRTLWQLLRLPFADFEKMAVQMSKSNAPETGGVVSSTGNDLLRMIAKGEREFSAQLSTMQRFTDFLKSPALGKNINSSSFDLNAITNGNTAVFLIIPAERLNTQAQWLRLVVTTLMRATIRKPKNRVCFVLDEAAALGYISEVETALGAYAGFGVSIWNVFQNFTQIKTLYGDNWENVISSSAVRHFFSVGDLFTADYISRYAGARTLVDFSAVTNSIKAVNSRSLLNPDEVRRATVDDMLIFIEAMQPVHLAKRPYFKNELMQNAAQPNPYYLNAPK